MFYGSVVVQLILSLSLPYIHGTNKTVSKATCERLPNYPTEAKLILSDDDPHINGGLIGLCPQNTTSITIIEGSQNINRYLHSDFFVDHRVSKLEEMHINVQNLVVEASISNQNASNYTTSLRSLAISSCNLSLPVLGAFRSLRDLRILDLSNCSLSELPTDLIAHSPNLELVNVSNNQFSFLPILFYNHTERFETALIDVSNNPIDCNCINTWLQSQGRFVGLSSCDSWPGSCEPVFSTRLYAETSEPYLTDDSLSVSVFTSRPFKLVCSINSTVPGKVYWITPIGVIPPPVAEDGTDSRNFTYFVQPILAPTVIRVSQLSASVSELSVENTRGHLSGDWYCVGRFPVGVSVSTPMRLNVISSIYRAHVYVLSLCYGYGAMAVLLLVGILGGTIRYCSETRCLTRPQPPFAYGGKTFIGVIPVPEVDEDSFNGKSHLNETYGMNEGSLQYVSAGRICNICLRPPTYWFCDECKAAHFVESVHELSAIDVLQTIQSPPEGELLPEGEIKIVTPSVRSAYQVRDSTTSVGADSPDARQMLIEKHLRPCETLSNTAQDNTSTTLPCLYVRCDNCVVRVRGQRLNNSPETFHPFDSLRALNAAVCIHSLHRPNSADVKLVVSNEKLAEEYREALADLARAVESPDPAHFREHLEEFRSRLRRDVGHGVKVLRGEFQGLRAKSAKSVANLRTQSTAAAQRMRAGFSHGVEQVKEGMRSVAELCGASGTIGQTISVVSVYVDETDQVKKERFVSDFVF